MFTPLTFVDIRPSGLAFARLEKPDSLLLQLTEQYKRYSPIMQSKRQGQVAELIKRNFSQVLQGEGSYIYGVEPLVTVTSVQVSPDLSLAKIYLSVWNTENKQAVLLQLEEEYGRLRSSLASRLKRQIRRIPEFNLFMDDTLDEMYRVDRMFDQLYRDGQMPEEGEEES